MKALNLSFAENEFNSQPVKTIANQFLDIKNNPEENSVEENKVVSIQDLHRAEVKAFVTKDKNLLQQYYQLRHDICTAENGWKDYDGSENEFDRQGKIIVATDKTGMVIGGARLMFSDMREYLYGETEGTQFTYKNVFKFLGIDIGNKIYGEIASFVMKADYRDRIGVEKIIEILSEESIKHRCYYVMGVSFLSRCRNYKLISSNLKSYKLKTEIVMKYPWIEKELYNYVKTFVTITSLENYFIHYDSKND